MKLEKTMEEFKKKSAADGDKEIVFSKAIKAGKRIYYLDVKKNRKDEMFLAITESKKIVSGEGIDSQVSFEKHKIFLYKEDFTKFMEGLQQAIQFIADEQGLWLNILYKRIDFFGCARNFNAHFACGEIDYLCAIYVNRGKNIPSCFGVVLNFNKCKLSFN